MDNSGGNIPSGIPSGSGKIQPSGNNIISSLGNFIKINFQERKEKS